MNPWLASASIAVLVATVPLGWVLRVLGDIPPPVVRSYRRWPDWANVVLVAVVTVVVTVFIRQAYYRPSPEPVSIGFQFLIAGVVYVFAIVLMVRQHVGLYAEYFITVGATGLALRKAAYRHITGVDTRSQSAREVQLEVSMESGERLILTIPSHHQRTFHELLDKAQPKL